MEDKVDSKGIKENGGRPTSDHMCMDSMVMLIIVDTKSY